MSQVIVECPIWKAILADERLADARRKLSFHEIRLIIGHALVAGTQSAETTEDLAQSEGRQSGGSDSERNAQGTSHEQP